MAEESPSRVQSEAESTEQENDEGQCCCGGFCVCGSFRLGFCCRLVSFVCLFVCLFARLIVCSP